MRKIYLLLLSVILLFGAAFIETSDMQVISNRAEAASYKQVEALHILVPTEQEAIDIRKEIMQGKDRSEIFNNFTAAAKKYSKCPSGSSGGILGWFGKGDMVPEFETAAFNLPNGQVSEPVKTPYGWHLIYVIAKK